MEWGGYNTPKEGGTILQKRSIKTLLFDMDNTLFDLVHAKSEACRAVTARLGAGDAGDLFSYFLRRQGGFDDPQNIREFMLDHSCYKRSLFWECMSLYREIQTRNLTPYPGVEQTLALLASSGFRLGIVTDAWLADATTRLEATGLTPFFDHVVTHEMTGAYKPSSLPFLLALVRMNATARETLLIGDSPRRDIAPAGILGICTVYARYGDQFFQPKSDGGADHAIDSFPELLAILEPDGRNTKAAGQATLS